MLRPKVIPSVTICLSNSKTIMEIDCQVISEVDTLVKWVNYRSAEMKVLDDMTKDLLVRFSVMEDCICILEEESIKKAVMVCSLLSEVEWL